MTQAPARIFVNSLPKAGTNLVSRAFDLAGIPYGKVGIAGTLLLGNHYLVRQVLRRSFFGRAPLMLGLEVQMPVRRAWLDRRLARCPQAAMSPVMPTGAWAWKTCLPHKATVPHW